LTNVVPNGLDQTAVRERSAVAREPGGELDVEHGARRDVEALVEDLEILAAGMNDGVDLRISDELGDRPDVDVLQRIDDVDALPGRHLHETEPGSIGLLAHELGVQSEDPVRARLLDEALHLGPINDHLRRWPGCRLRQGVRPSPARGR
jgi:hypothetical protein